MTAEQHECYVCGMQTNWCILHGCLCKCTCDHENPVRKEAQWEDGWTLWPDEHFRKASAKRRQITTVKLHGSYL